MRYRPFYKFLMALAFLTSCSENKEMISDYGTMPIRLAIHVSSNETRAQAQDEQLTSGQTVYVWAKHTGTDDDYLRAWSLTADGNGGLTPASTTRYYPADGTNLDIYALHGNITTPASFTESTNPTASASADATDGTELPVTVTHTIKTSQESAANYSASDLFAVKVENVGPRLNANQGNNYYVALPFQHQLARIEVRIVNFNDLLPKDIESITLCGVKTQTTFNMPDASSANGYIGAVGTTAATPTADIVMHPIDCTSEDPNNSKYHDHISRAECVIPAQELSSSAALVVVKLKHNSSATSVANDKLYFKPGSLTFDIENGKTYRLDFSISKVEMTGFKVDWADWGWIPTDDLTESDWLPYYTREEMDKSKTGFNDFTGESNSGLNWEYGDGDNTNEKNKGTGWN